MSLSYETVVGIDARDLFLDTFAPYMERSGFDHMTIGGRFGRAAAHEFRRGDHLVSCSVSAENQHRFRVVVTSDTIPVEPLIADSLTEGVADFLEPFCKSLSGEGYEEVMSSLVKQLREAFDRLVVD